MQIDFGANNLNFLLPPCVDISNAEAFASQLKFLVADGKSGLALDASKVESVTLPGLQAIIAAQKSLQSSGRNLTVKNESEAFVDAARDLGLEILLSGSL